MRGDRGAPQFLLVRPSNGRDEWVLPKGHLDPGEAPEAAAVREIREEAGVEAAIEASLGRLEQASRSGPALVAWYLMRFVRAAEAEEEREIAWFGLEEALERASFESARSLLLAASKRRGERGRAR